MEKQKEKKKKIQKEVFLPEGVTATIDKDVLIIRKEKAEIRKILKLEETNIKVDNNTIKIQAKYTNKTSKRQTATIASLIKNSIKGVQEGHTYKLKICEGHFPMTVAVKGDNLEIKNFVGERKPRLVKITPSVKVTVNAQEITVEGEDKELVGEQAAKIEQTTRRKKFDKRKFQEGIYITEKSGKKIA